ncbi:MAG TPA: universal stress protein [Gemmatimonadaceae bacterium]|jgi:nucleotide-binding universal stress UspA family protein
MYRSLLVPLDGSMFAEQALPFASAILERSKALLTLLRVHRPLGYGEGVATGRWDREQRESEGEYLARVAEQMSECANVKVSTELLEEPVVSALCDYVRGHAVDLIVMSTHGRTGIRRAWLGSVADGVARNVSVPVLMVRPRDEAGEPDRLKVFERMLIPLDGSRLSESIVGHAVRLARVFGSDIVLFRAVEPVVAKGPGYPLSSPVPVTLIDSGATERLTDLARKYLEDLAARLREQYGLRVSIEVRLVEHAAPAIVDALAAHHIDLVALSTHGRGASRVVVGSVADALVRASPRAFLLFHPAED